MKVVDFKEQFLKLPVMYQQKTCWNMINKATAVQKKSKAFKDLKAWAMGQLSFDDELAVMLPDAQALAFFQKD